MRTTGPTAQWSVLSLSSIRHQRSPRASRLARYGYKLLPWLSWRPVLAERGHYPADYDRDEEEEGGQED